jgi:hypothetical protein
MKEPSLTAELERIAFGAVALESAKGELHDADQSQ